ncbi:hypothetical protein MtrunA17_Chr3g0102321 [Medicago truncatula]|uniref:Transmembrane protein, putative n=1 Tax=Medicago truncatula TaxID=3880 RepID=A0A072V7C6_MEDTR|nr:uncharacterized protein LOC25489144 [Medicago truncatula]KEH34075.1 transmembrane protein, putative [Medicago truncatula]RHN67398.1 hypothetical protein MtrunA17_Chr3g0102321 [Medicago truncatula]
MIMMKANKQRLCSKLNSNLSTFLTIMLILVFLSFFFSISKYFSFLLAIPIALVSTLFLVTLKKKKGSKNESVVQEKLLKEKLQSALDVSETEYNIQSENAENHKEQAEAQLEYSFPLDSESRNFLVMDRTFEFSVPEHMQQDDLRLDSSFPSDSERSNGSIVGETFEFDHNRYQNLSHDRLVSDTDDEDGEYDYDDHDEGFNRIIVDTNNNLNGKEGSLVSYSSLVYPISDDNDYEDYEVEDEDEEDNLIEIHLPSRNLSNLTEESMQKLEARPDFISESIFNQQSLMQLLAEMNDMNEDENLIEIDISR